MSVLLLDGIGLAKLDKSVPSGNQIAYISSFDSFDDSPVLRRFTCFQELDGKFTGFPKQCFGSGSKQKRVALVGDSHAASLSFGLLSLGTNLYQFTSTACPPLINVYRPDRPKCEEINNYAFLKIKLIKPAYVLLEADWSLYGYSEDQIHAYIQKTIDSLENQTYKPKIIILGGLPQWHPSLPDVILKSHIAYSVESRIKNQDYSLVNNYDSILSRVSQETGVEFVPLLPATCNGSECKVFSSDFNNRNEPIAHDYAHLTQGGSILFSEYLKKVLSNFR